MGYVESLLSNGERIVVRERRHWLSVPLDSRWAILALVGAVALMLLNLDGTTSGPKGTVGQVLGFVILGLVIYGVAWIGWTVWNWWNEDYIVTNRRVLHVEGVINKHASDSSLEKINDAALDQHFIGRIFGYGDLDILTASADTHVDRFKMVNRVIPFKREMLNQKNELEFEQMRPPVSPPLRAATSTSVTPPPAPAPMAPPHQQPAMSATGDVMPDLGAMGSNGGGAPQLRQAPTAPRVEERRMAPADVTATLKSLAELRDGGAITPEEYDAKKVELLSRL